MFMIQHPINRTPQASRIEGDSPVNDEDQRAEIHACTNMHGEGMA